MYQVNIVIQWQDGHYEELRGVGPCWKTAKETAIETANAIAIVKIQGFRVLSEKEWRALPKPVSCNNWVPKKAIPPPEPPKEDKPVQANSWPVGVAKGRPRLAKSTLSNWKMRRA